MNRLLRISNRLLPSLLLGLLVVGSHVVQSAPSESGLSRIADYQPHDYNGHSQVFQSVQGPDGVMYFTNYGTVLTWDGERWGRIPVPGAGFLYGIVALDDGQFVVCGVNTFAIIEGDGAGGWRSRSLAGDLPDAVRNDLGEVWDMAVTPDGLFFFTRRHMIRWTPEGSRTWSFETEKTIYGFWTGSDIYVQNLDDGLYHLDGDELIKVSEQPLFLSPGPRMMTNWENGRILIATMKEGLWLFDGESLEPFQTEAADYLSNNILNKGIQLKDGRLAFGTFHGGVVVIDREGNFERLINEEAGLPNDTITHLSQDRENGLWVSMGSGIARVEVDGLITLYDRSLGLPNVVVSGILRHNGNIWASSADGLYWLQPVEPPALPRWNRIPGTGGEVNAIVPYEDHIFATTKGQVIRTDGKTSEVVWDDFGLLRALMVMRQAEDHLLVGGRIGLGLVYRENGEWKQAGPVTGLEDHVISIAEDADGDIWLGTVFSGVLRVRSHGLGTDWIENAEIERLGTESGLNALEHILVRFEDGQLTAITPGGPQVFDRETGRFLDVETQHGLAPPEDWAWDVQLENETIGAFGSVYPLVGAEDDFSLYVGNRSPEGDWRWVSPSLFDDIGGLLFLYFENGDPDVLWAGGWSGLMRWELTGWRDELRSGKLEVSLREIRLPDGELAYSGSATMAEFSFPHSRESISFTYTAPVHTPAVEVSYRTRLEGYESEWTDWHSSAERSFNNLPGGEYEFMVEARTPSGLTSRSSSAVFTVLPPWYQSPVAYAGYIALGGLVFWGGARLRLAALRRENRRLEEKVDERTTELAHSERELRKARDAAEFANKQKSRFLANMSHELRTPLNAIMGYAQILERDPDLDQRNRQRVGILNTSCNLLVHLINEVLDLSKIEAGRLEVQEQPAPLARTIQSLVDSFGAKASQKGLVLECVADSSLPETVLVDIRKVEQIVSNLVGNALKFTETGSVTITMKAEANRICIDVEDTGIGIPEEEREAVFDAFYQTSEQPGKEAGTGLGLAISRRLAEVMGGNLECHARQPGGTCFRLVLPLQVVADTRNLSNEGSRRFVGYAGKRRTVMVVDDVPANRDIVVELLEPLGFTVDTAATGEAALKRLEKGGIDAILLDVRMSPMSGVEVLRRLRELPGGAELPVISYSASLIGFTRKEALEMGCDEWLPKPFTPEDLFGKLGSLLEIEWQHGEADSEARPQAGWDSYQFSKDDLERLRALAWRREPAGLKDALEDILQREPESSHVVKALLALVARFRLGEISDQLEATSPREASS